MADSDVFAEMAAEAADLRTVPSDEKVARLRAAGTRMVLMAQTVARLEEELKRANEALWEYRMKTLPDIMAELKVDNIGLPEAGVDLVAKSYAHANIQAEWTDEKKKAAFDHIEELGGGDIIRTTLTFFFGKDERENMLEWIEKVRGLNLTFDPPEMTERMAVPWNTLTAWVKEQVRVVRGENDPQLDLEKIGAYVGTEVVIKTRKE